MLDILKEKIKIFKENWSKHFAEVFFTVVTQIPIFLIGQISFYLATSFEPTGGLGDLRIKFWLYFGRILMAVYFGEIAWNLIFPFLDVTLLDSRKKVDYHLMYGRLIMHFIMQISMIFI